MSEIKKYYDNFGIMSVDPPTAHLTFGYWIYLVPQYKPKNILMLGYAGGTVAGLIRLLYGDVPITAVDLEPSENKYGVNLIKADAREYIKNCPHFDAVIVDLAPRNEANICDFVLTKEFADDLKKIANYIAINTFGTEDMSAYNSLEYVGMNQPSGLNNKIYYYQTIKIPDLRILKNF